MKVTEVQPVFVVVVLDKTIFSRICACTILLMMMPGDWRIRVKVTERSTEKEPFRR